MKKLVISLIVVLTMISCKTDNKQLGYLVTFSYSSVTITPNNIKDRGDCKINTTYLGEMNDSLINSFINRKKAEYDKNLDRWIKSYMSTGYNMRNDDINSYKSVEAYTKATMDEIKSSAKLSMLRSKIGQKVILIVFSDSLLNSVNGDYMRIIEDSEKSFSELYRIYEIYDGTTTAVKLENDYLEAWYKKHRDYSF